MTREEAIEVLRANYPDACFEQLREAVDIAIEVLSEPKTGRWILTPMLPDIHRYKCSNCMSHHRARYEFCPSCGAKMVSCEKCKHWESDTGYCYEIADSDRHECNFEQI